MTHFKGTQLLRKGGGGSGARGELCSIWRKSPLFERRLLSVNFSCARCAILWVNTWDCELSEDPSPYHQPQPEFYLVLSGKGGTEGALCGVCVDGYEISACEADLDRIMFF